MKKAEIRLGYGIAIGMIIAAIILGILGIGIYYFMR